MTDNTTEFVHELEIDDEVTITRYNNDHVYVVVGFEEVNVLLRLKKGISVESLRPIYINKINGKWAGHLGGFYFEGMSPLGRKKSKKRCCCCCC